MYIRRIKNKLKNNEKMYGFYWYKSVRTGNKVVGKFVRKATENEIKRFIKNKKVSRIV